MEIVSIRDDLLAQLYSRQYVKQPMEVVVMSDLSAKKAYDCSLN